MTRWIAVGIVVGFGVAVLAVSVLRPQAPPPAVPAPPPPAASPLPRAPLAVPVEVPRPADRHLRPDRAALVLELDHRTAAPAQLQADAGP